ncbi:MAG: SelT/SelW/SelH family protein [Chitinivibrionales bacterium]|nr:SelT/SelW/SelH family protein [Chitinivibrionales bacterium]
MADELKREHGADSELVGGSGGIFDVYVEGKLVFSKHEKGRFPNPGEVAKLI